MPAQLADLLVDRRPAGPCMRADRDGQRRREGPGLEVGEGVVEGLEEAGEEVASSFPAP